MATLHKNGDITLTPDEAYVLYVTLSELAAELPDNEPPGVGDQPNKVILQGIIDAVEPIAVRHPDFEY